MTNLIASRRRQWITRGRVLVGLPMAFGLLLCVPLVVVLLRPTWQNVQELGRRRDSLLQLQRNLPAVEAKLEAETAALEGVEQQQASLIGLLAGQDKVQTFLALLNQQALLSGVSIQRYEPMTTPNPPSATQRRTSRPTSGTGDEPPEPKDPLQELGYQKSSIALAVSGSYAGLQEFLQRMEALELLVESSDLEIKAGIQGNDQEGATPPVESRTQLTLRLSFYDPQLEVDVDSENSKETAPS